MILAGGGANLPGIVVYLAQAFGIEVQIGDPWYNLIKDHAKESEIGESRPIFAVATGLARRRS
jgi:Tfp pilus assembly PilM family ATPase